MAQSIRREPQSPAAERRRDVERLGPWFHNLHLPDGSETAPDHPLGDFPRYKWKGPRAAPPRTAGRLDRARHRRQRGVLHLRGGAPGRAGRPPSTSTPTISTRLEWAAREYGLESSVEFRAHAGVRSGRLGRAIRPRALSGRVLSPAIPAARARHRRAPGEAAARVPDAHHAGHGGAGRHQRSPARRACRPAGAGMADDGVHRGPFRRRSDQLVGAQPRRGHGAAPLERPPGPLASGPRVLHLRTAPAGAAGRAPYDITPELRAASGRPTA